MFMDKDAIAMRNSVVKMAVDQPQKKNCMSNFTPFVLLIGLGTHAIFEGLALGIEPKPEKALIFAIAITLHKGAAGMSLGISM
jgi:zinc transporter 1/2/3